MTQFRQLPIFCQFCFLYLPPSMLTFSFRSILRQILDIISFHPEILILHYVSPTESDLLKTSQPPSRFFFPPKTVFLRYTHVAMGTSDSSLLTAVKASGAPTFGLFLLSVMDMGCGQLPSSTGKTAVSIHTRLLWPL